MTVPARRPATYEDILALPEHVIGEIINGELVVSPRPSPRHAEAASSLAGILIPPLRFGDGGPGGWRILYEPELHLGEHVVVPDLAGWRLERMPSLPDEAFFTLVPDWICEVLSPGTSRVDRTRKMPIYARAGVPYLWLIDPAVETLEVFKLREGAWLLLGTHGGDESVRVEPFADVVIQLSKVWGRDTQVSR